jgi:hypothetical protein
MEEPETRTDAWPARMPLHLPYSISETAFYLVIHVITGASSEVMYPMLAEQA